MANPSSSMYVEQESTSSSNKKSSGTCYTDIKNDIIAKSGDASVFPDPSSEDYVKGTSSAIAM